MDGHTRRVFAANLTLAGVKSAAHLQTQLFDAIHDLFGASNSAAGTVKGSQYAIPGCFDQSAPKVKNTVLANFVVIIKQALPGLIADPVSRLSGLDDVGEHDRGKDPCFFGRGPDSSQEFLNFVKDHVLVANPRYMIVSWKFFELRPWDSIRQPSPFFDVYIAITGAMED